MKNGLSSSSTACLFAAVGYLCLGLILCGEKASEAKPLPYQNPDLPLEDRVNDLVSRMTLNEKISQMMNDAPAVERLGIPKYNWWDGAPAAKFNDDDFGVRWTGFFVPPVSGTYVLAGEASNQFKIFLGDSLLVQFNETHHTVKTYKKVVQLYVKDIEASAPVPVRSLQGFKRIRLAPGEKQTVSFTMTPQQLSLIDKDMNRAVEPGIFEISVGGKQPGFKGCADARTTEVLTAKIKVKGEKKIV